MDPTRTLDVFVRQASASPIASGTVGKLLDLIASPFQTRISTNAFIASIVTSLGATFLIALAFCFVRPLNNVVYAPRSKYADSKHAPPPIGRAPFAWLQVMISTKEQDLVERVGLDATIFIRFIKMCRNIFIVLTVIGCGVLIPTNLIAGHQETSAFSKRQDDSSSGSSSSSTSGEIGFFSRLTPQFMWQSPAFWAYVPLAYVFNIVIAFFLWRNYRAVVQLRRQHFQSQEYQASLHSRTLFVSNVPRELRSDEGLVKLVEEVRQTNDTPRAAIARNAKDLPDLVEEHSKTVKELEEVLAKYLKDPNRLPTKRPTCKASKSDKTYSSGQTVDAIEYLSARIKELEIEIREVRESVDKRNAMPYGFASYQYITSAHNVAYAARKSAPQQTIMKLAPRPHDLIWKNLSLTPKERSWRNFINNVWVGVLTGIWMVPNILMAVFLSNLAHLGSVWPAFNRSLEAHPVWWGIVQGVAAPAITSIFYYFLPAIFRRLSTQGGDVTKTSRDRHVLHKLFAFFIFNNLFVYSLFSAIWTFITAVIASHKGGESIWDSIKKGELFQTIILSLISVSTFWTSWVLQRNLGAAIDLAQIVNLAWGSFSRRFLSPTPRQLIELSAPQPFDYASYYNYFLFYSCVTLTFAFLQPLIIPVTAFYFFLDSFMKKYLILYVCITKTESGGQFWRVLFNRWIVNMLFGWMVVALLLGAVGSSWVQLGALGPIPFLILAFKWYCARTFDDQLYYVSTGTSADTENTIVDSKTKKHDRVGMRFGNPVLYKPLITPMVHARAQHLLKDIYTGRTSTDGADTVGGYSDVYMDQMQENRPGKSANATAGSAPFEIVGENELDFKYYKDRPEFADELGGEGELYGRPADMIRRGSDGSFMTSDTFGKSRYTPTERSRSGSRDRAGNGEHSGTVYPSGYNAPAHAREHSPADSIRSQDMGAMRGRDRDRGEQTPGDDRSYLLGGAQRMGRSPPPTSTPGNYLPYTPAGFTPTIGTPGEGEETSYDYFRRGRGL